MKMKLKRGRRLGVGVMVLTGVLGVTEARSQATEAATPVPLGTWRLDSDVYARAEDWNLPAGWGGRARAESWGWAQIAAGVTERLDLQAGWQAFQKFEVDGVADKGAGDLYLAAKCLVSGDEGAGAAWGVMPYVKLPTSGGRFTDDTVDPGLLLIFGRPLGDAGYVNAQLGFDDYGDGAGGRDQGASASAVAGFHLGERATAYAETLAGMYPLNGDRDSFGASAGLGATWSGDAEGGWGVDVAAYGGVTRAAPDLLAVLRVWWQWSGGDR